MESWRISEAYPTSGITLKYIPLEQPEGSGKYIMTGREMNTGAVLARAY